jgi:nucleoside-diphosphate-sugar epimerase
MRTLIIGATGFAGFAVAQRLLTAGHEVSGLARSEIAAKKLSAAGVRAVSGDVLNAAAVAPLLRQFDCIVFTPRIDLQIEAAVVPVLLEAIEGTGKRFVFTSGTGVLATKTEGDWDEVSYAEDDPFARTLHAGIRVDTENLVRAASKRGVHAMVIRPPLVWGPGGIARSLMSLHASARSGAVGYLGRGLNMTSSIHVDDLAEIFALALQKGESGALYHAVSGEQSWRALAGEVARLRGLPTRSLSLPEAEELFGKAYTQVVFRSCNRTRCPRTRHELGWKPHPDRMDIFAECARPEYMSNAGAANKDFDAFFPRTR